MEVTYLESNLNEVVIVNYDGEYDEISGQYTGFAVAKLDNECVYEGNFVRGLFHGKGKFTWSDGVIYEGEFYRNQMQGQGTYYYTDGSVYIGAVKDGKRHGQGKLTNSGGQIYDGAWQDGQRHGVGKMFYNEEQTIAYTGEWRENNRHGYGVMRYGSGNTYEGQWQQDHKHGFGVMIWRDMDETYIGEWLDDLPHGYGEHIWGDSTAKTVKKQHCNMYRGEFQCGQRHGRGTFFYMNGSNYSGFWREDCKHGPGVFVHPDGKMTVGDYDMNRLITNTLAATASSPGNESILSPTVNNNPLSSKSNSTTTINGKINVNTNNKVSTPAGNTNGNNNKNKINVPGIATKLPTITESQPLPAPPSTANVNAGTNHPNNISVQYHLHILDILAKFPAHPRLLDVDHHSPATLAAVGAASAASPLHASMTLGHTSGGHTALGSVDYAKTLHDRRAAIHEVERLLLKYNSHLKSLYRRFNEQSNRLRQKEMVLIPSLSDSGTTPYSPEEKTWKLKKAALTARAFHRRVHCASLREAIQCLRELGLVNGATVSVYDVTQIFRAMKRQHAHTALELYRSYLQELQALEESMQLLEMEAMGQLESPSTSNLSVVNNNNIKKPSSSSSPWSLPATPQRMTPSLPVLPLQVDSIENEAEFTARREKEWKIKAKVIKGKIHAAEIAIGQLLDDYLLFSDDSRSIIQQNEDGTFRFEAMPGTNTASEVFHRLGVAQQPLLEHEFMELIVRVSLEFALRHGYHPKNNNNNNNDDNNNNNHNNKDKENSFASVCWAWMTPYQIVEKVLAEKLFPLVNHGNHDIPEVVQDLYDDQLQDLFHQRANKLLDVAFTPASLAMLTNNNNQSTEEAKNTEDLIAKKLPDNAQGLLLAQWESLKEHAILHGHLNVSEMYPVSPRGVLGWVRYKDFVDWFVANNTLQWDGSHSDLQENKEETKDTAEKLEQWAMKTQSFVSLQHNVGAWELSRLLSVDMSQVSTILVQPSENSVSETVVSSEEEEPNSAIGNKVEMKKEEMLAVDATWCGRKMVYEDFIEALVRIWSQNERIVRVTNPLFVNQQNSVDDATNIDQNNNVLGVTPQATTAGQDNASIDSNLDDEDVVGGIGGWLDVGSSVSSSVLSNQLLHRLLLWLLTQRQRLVTKSQ